MTLKLIYSIMLAVWCTTVMAGNPPHDGDKQTPSDPITRARVVYVEYGGPSAHYSVNYDMRFKGFNGWGVRFGAAFLPQGPQRVFSFPAQLNYLFGKNSHFFELGAGATYYYTNIEGSIWGVDANKGGSVFGTLIAGYRYQPQNNRFVGRVGATAMAGSFIPGVIPYIGVGYRF